MSLHGTAQRLAHDGGEIATRRVAEKAPERLEILLHARVHGDAKRPLLRSDGAQLGGAPIAQVRGAAISEVGGAAIAQVGAAAIAQVRGARARKRGRRPSSALQRAGAGELVRCVASCGESL
jgi:hypothetical protein